MRKMNKVISAVLAAVMVMSVGFTALADETVAGGSKPVGTTETSDKVAVTQDLTFSFQKVYVTTTGEVLDGIVPAETLDFEIVAAAGNPDRTMITVEDPTISSNPQDVVLTIPNTYNKVGKYNYTVKEIAGHTQGVTYSTNDTFNVQVLISWNDEHTELQKQVSLTSGTAGNKVDKITNKYDIGTLEVKKIVTGNLGDRDKDFEVEVVFAAEKYTDNNVEHYKDVKSAITYTDNDGDDATEDKKTIEVDDWKDGTVTVKIYLKHDETVTFENIPVGVTYKITEADYKTLINPANSKENDANGYDTPKYSYTTNVENAVEADWAAEKIRIDDKDRNIIIVNNKGTEVDTGITLDNMPYILILAVVALGAVGFVSKKRSSEF